MSSGSPQYEFTREQNTLIGSLAHKMRWVGLFFVVVGLLDLIMAGLLVAAIYKSKLPPDWINKVPQEVQSQLEQVQSQLQQPNHNLWGMAAGTAVSGQNYLLIGAATRPAAAL